MLNTGAGPPEVVTALRRLDAEADERARTRAARGGIAVDSRERTFRVEHGDVVEGGVEAGGPSHRLVEELMLAANEAVAAELADTGTAAVFRVHEPPEPAALEALAERLEALE